MTAAQMPKRRSAQPLPSAAIWGEVLLQGSGPLQRPPPISKNAAAAKDCLQPAPSLRTPRSQSGRPNWGAEDATFPVRPTHSWSRQRLCPGCLTEEGREDPSTLPGEQKWPCLRSPPLQQQRLNLGPFLPSLPSLAGWGLHLPRREERKQAVITGQLPASPLAASLRERRAWPRGIRVSNCPDLFLHLSRPRGCSPAPLLGPGFRLRITWPDLPGNNKHLRRGTIPPSKEQAGNEAERSKDKGGGERPPHREGS